MHFSNMQIQTCASVVTQVIDICHFFAEIINTRRQTIAIFLDLSSCYLSMSHTLQIILKHDLRNKKLVWDPVIISSVGSNMYKLTNVGLCNLHFFLLSMFLVFINDVANACLTTYLHLWWGAI